MVRGRVLGLARSGDLSLQLVHVTGPAPAAGNRGAFAFNLAWQAPLGYWGVCVRICRIRPVIFAILPIFVFQLSLH